MALFRFARLRGSISLCEGLVEECRRVIYGKKAEEVEKARAGNGYPRGALAQRDSTITLRASARSLFCGVLHHVSSARARGTGAWD
jgi:hypothetical protein